jgi:hypothetical protein
MVVESRSETLVGIINIPLKPPRRLVNKRSLVQSTNKELAIFAGRCLSLLESGQFIFLLLEFILCRCGGRGKYVVGSCPASPASTMAD